MIKIIDKDIEGLKVELRVIDRKDVEDINKA